MFTRSKRRQEFKILALLGLTFAVTHLENNQAQAQTASASGSATLTSGGTIVETFTAGVLTGRTITNGVITSVSGETVLPSGYFFSDPVVVVPTYSNLTSGASTVPVVNSLSIAATPTVTATNASFSRAAAEILTNAASNPGSIVDIDNVTAIIRAGAGVNGLD
jgi:hypothetical protein